jgi:hypothetical protein
VTAINLLTTKRQLYNRIRAREVDWGSHFPHYSTAAGGRTRNAALSGLLPVNRAHDLDLRFVCRALSDSKYPLNVYKAKSHLGYAELLYWR